jgi:membrane associated rhomboid family serine protease
LACGIVSNIFSDLITPDQFNNMIKLGASNPLYGLIAVSAGYMVINWNSMASIGPIFKFRILITLILVLVFMFMFTDQAGSPDYVGHLGGLLTGFLISGLLPSLKL